MEMMMRLRLGRLQSVEGEYFLYRAPTKLVCEIIIILSSVVAISSVGTLVGLGMELEKTEPMGDHEDILEIFSSRDINFALFIYSIVILIVSISDIIFALILHRGTNQLKISYCLFWRGATVTSLIVLGMLTLAFMTMIRDLILVLGYLPSLISKPFALFIVNGFVHELAELRTFPSFTVDGIIPPAKSSFNDSDELKNATTVFVNMHQKFGRGGGGSSSGRRQQGYVVTSKLKSIPE